MALRMSGRHSKSVLSSSDSTDSTAGLTSGLPSLPLVWPSNWTEQEVGLGRFGAVTGSGYLPFSPLPPPSLTSGSTTLTLTIAVSPSLTNSPGILPSCLICDKRGERSEPRRVGCC